MEEQMNMWNFWMIIGLIAGVMLLVAASIITSFRHLTWQKQQKLQREAWEEEQKRQQEERKKQEYEEKQRMRAQFGNADWLKRAADCGCGREQPADRIEIWENQIIIETGKEYEIYPLEQFGIGETLTKEEIYCANMALYDAVCSGKRRRYYLEDQGLHCEIIRIR